MHASVKASSAAGSGAAGELSFISRYIYANHAHNLKASSGASGAPPLVREYRLVSHDVMNFALDPAGGDALVVHHSAANSLRYHNAAEGVGTEIFALEAGEFLEFAMSSYPEWIDSSGFAAAVRGAAAAAHLPRAEVAEVAAEAFDTAESVAHRLVACGVFATRARATTCARGGAKKRRRGAAAEEAVAAAVHPEQLPQLQQSRVEQAKQQKKKQKKQKQKKSRLSAFFG
jgi:hypothetical protein